MYLGEALIDALFTNAPIRRIAWKLKESAAPELSWTRWTRNEQGRQGIELRFLDGSVFSELTIEDYNANDWEIKGSE